MAICPLFLKKCTIKEKVPIAAIPVVLQSVLTLGYWNQLIIQVSVSVVVDKEDGTRGLTVY